MKRKSDSSIKTLSPKDASKNSKGIRTRLSTGTLVMSGTSTISLSDVHAQESASLSNSSSAESDVTISKQKESTSVSGLKRKHAEDNDFGESSNEPPKRRKIGRNDGTGEGNRNDYFCWICHKDGVMICCELCPRVFHSKCLSIENNVPQDWVCPECEKIMQAECTDTRSKTMALISVSTLCTLLRYALDRMRTVGSDTFERPVDPALLPNYSEYIFHPMSLSVLEKNIRKKNYGCTEAFLADAKWMYHNSVVYNGVQNKITSTARAVLKVCKHEMSEIEVCPDCYYNSCLQSDSDWFCEPCRNPHPLVWAKLKGYPFWPAKALREINDQVDVRFFGAHDRSWVPVSSCFMLSKVCPVVVKKGRGGMTEAMREVEVHIKKLREKLGSFEYAPFHTPYSSDSVNSKVKSGTSSDGSKHTGHGKMGKTKGGDGRLGDKQSVVSKTAMALKSKYISMSSKKGSQQQPVAVLKPGATQPQQIIYLKPMPKGVFLLSEQAIEPVDVNTTHGTILRRNIPDLQLIKHISDKIQPEVPPVTSEAANSKTEKTSDCKEGELTQLKDVGNEMETDAGINSGDRESTDKGEVTLGETREESRDVMPLSVADVPLSAKDVPLPAKDVPLTATDVTLPATNVPLTTTDVTLTATDVPLPATDVPLPATDVPLSTTNMPSSATNMPSSATNMPSSATHTSVQNSLLSENLETNTNVSIKQLEKSEYTIISTQADKATEEEICEGIKDNQHLGLEKQKQIQAGPDIDSSFAEGVNPPAAVDTVSLDLDVSNEDENKSNSVQEASTVEADVNREHCNCTSVEVSNTLLSPSSQFSSKETSDQRRAPGNNETTTPSLNEASNSASVTEKNVDEASNSASVTEKNVEEASNSASVTEKNVDEVSNSASVTEKDVEFTVCGVKTHDKNEKADNSAECIVKIVSPIRDNNMEKSINPIDDKVRDMGTGASVSEPAEKEEHCKLTQLCDSDGRDSVECAQNVSAGDLVECPQNVSAGDSVECAQNVSAGDSVECAQNVSAGDSVECAQNVSAASPSPCLSSISIVSSSNTSSTTMSVVTASPGSTYKESLQKVIDSCKAKLGIDEKNLNNVDNDVIMLEGDDEDDSIIISDNELDDDSDVLLMDIDEHDEEPSYLALSDLANYAAKVNASGDASASLSATLSVTPAETVNSAKVLEANLHSEILAKDAATSSDKDTPSRSALENEKTHVAELEKNSGSVKAITLTDESASLSSNVVTGAFKEKSGKLDIVYEAPTARSFVYVVSRNQNKTSGSDVSTEASTNKTTDSNLAGSETISVQSTSMAKTINTTSNEQARRSEDEAVSTAVLKQAVVTHSVKTSEAVDEASFMSLVDDDDDQYNYCIDDNVTLDMEVVCSDGPEENSDEDIMTDDEDIAVVANTSSIHKENSGANTNVSGRNSMQSTLLPPGKIIIVGNQYSRDTSSNVVNYTSLRGALTAPPPSLNIPQHSKKSLSPPTGTASTSGVPSSTHFTVSKFSGNLKISPADPLQQKIVPRIMLSKHKRKTPTTASSSAAVGDRSDFENGDMGRDSCDVGITSRYVRDKRAENPSASTAVDLNGNEQLTESHIDPASRDDATRCQRDLSVALNVKIQSLVKNRYSLFEKFVTDQLSELAVDVKKATEMSMPPQVDDTRQKVAIEKLRVKYTKKREDLKKAMNESLKESLANFKIQKSLLVEKLKEEFNKELQKVVADTKKQQWCAECWKEAVYYCCWNTSYCSYQCQQKHWPTHMPKCMQTQLQAPTTTTSSQSPTIISTLNATAGTNRSNTSVNASSIPSGMIIVPTTPSTHPTAAVTSMTASKAAYRVPTVSIVSPSQWKATEEAAKAKKMYSLVSPQPNSTSISTLSIGPPHFQIQYLQQQGTAGSLPQQVQVMGANPSSVPLLMPSMMTSQNQNQVASPVHLLQNASLLPLMQRQPQTGIPQQAQPIGAARYIIPSTFGTFMRPGGPV